MASFQKKPVRNSSLNTLPEENYCQPETDSEAVPNPCCREDFAGQTPAQN